MQSYTMPASFDRQVLLTAVLVSAVCKKLDDGHDDLDDDEQEPTLNSDEEWLHTSRQLFTSGCKVQPYLRFYF